MAGDSDIQTNKRRREFQLSVGRRRPPIDDLAVENRDGNFGVGQPRRGQGEDVLRQDHDVGQHVALERALPVLVERGPGGIARVGVDGLPQRQPFAGNPAPFGLPLGRRAVDRDVTGRAADRASTTGQSLPKARRPLLRAMLP